MKAPKRPHILYVEDDDDSCRMMTILLHISGIDVTCVQGMTDAIQLPNKETFDLFLLDLWLHDGDGNELCKVLRAEFSNIPVVFYTGCATERERKQSTVSGAAAYLVKPYSELIAPMIFKLVNGVDTDYLAGRPIDPLQILQQKAQSLINIMDGPGKAIPLSP